MSVGAVPGVSFYVPHLAKVSAVGKTQRVTRGGRVKRSGTFILPDEQGGERIDRPTADPAAASTSAATLAALASLTRGG